MHILQKASVSSIRQQANALLNVHPMALCVGYVVVNIPATSYFKGTLLHNYQRKLSEGCWGP